MDRELLVFLCEYFEVVAFNRGEAACAWEVTWSRHAHLEVGFGNVVASLISV
jgi:hypothetical protein